MVKMRTVPRGSCVSMLGLQLVGLFRKIMQVLRGRALLEEVYHWGWDLSCAVG